MKKSKLFSEELLVIDSGELARAVAVFLDEFVADYFCEIPASSSGKYHPWYSLGYGGLVRHTKAAVRIAIDLLSLEQNSKLSKDEIIAALIIHDTFKQGVSGTGHTVHEHPILVCDALSTFIDIYASELQSKTIESLQYVMSLVASHMGEWNRNTRSTIVLPKPENEDQKFVHLCDYLASRKYIIVEVE